MTMVPRAGPLSAISAPAITSWDQRGKSSSRVTIAPFAIRAGYLARAGRPDGLSAPGVVLAVAPDDLDLLRGAVGVGARRVQERTPVGLRLRLGVRIGGGDARLDPFGHQTLGLVDQRPHHVRLGNDADDLAADEEVALLLPRRDADVGFAGLARAVHDAPHHRHLDGQVQLLERLLGLLGHGDDVDLGPAAGRAGDEVDALALAQAQRLQELAPGPGLLDGV